MLYGVCCLLYGVCWRFRLNECALTAIDAATAERSEVSFVLCRSVARTRTWRCSSPSRTSSAGGSGGPKRAAASRCGVAPLCAAGRLVAHVDLRGQPLSVTRAVICSSTARAVTRIGCIAVGISRVGASSACVLALCYERVRLCRVSQRNVSRHPHDCAEAARDGESRRYGRGDGRVHRPRLVLCL